MALGCKYKKEETVFYTMSFSFDDIGILQRSSFKFQKNLILPADN